MSREHTHRRLAAIFAADVVGYSQRMSADEVGTLARLNAVYAETVRPAVSRYSGRVFKEMGDGLLAEFASAVDAVLCAWEIQEAIRQQRLEIGDDCLEFRIGINVGDVIIDGDDVFGDGVNIASRLEAVADSGGVALSEEVYRHVGRKVNLNFDDLGNHQFKNIPQPIRVYRLVTAEEPIAPIDVEVLLARPTLAVLPLTNMSGDPDQDYFADGLTEDIITALSCWRYFPVIARNSSFAFKGETVSVKTIADKLGARYVLEGSVRKSGDHVRISARLVDAITEHHVWAERFDGALGSIFELQDEITEKIAAIVAPELERAERKRLSTAKGAVSAWDLHQRGMACFYQTNRQSNATAKEFFKKAIESDPNFSTAYASLAFCYHAEVAIWQVDNREEILSKAIAAATKAVELDNGDSYAQAILGTVYLRMGKHDLGLACCRHAIALNPSNSLAHAILGNALSFAGHPIEGISSIQRALLLNPHDPNAHFYINMIARSYLTAREHDQAVEFARESIGRHANHAFAYIVLASALGHLGQREEAQTAIDECERIDPGRIGMEARVLPVVFQNLSDAKHVMDGLHKAGWTESPQLSKPIGKL